MEYESRNFKDLYATEIGKRLWIWLQDPQRVFAMEIATKLRRPAVEAIGDELLDEFGEVVRGNRFKQMIGHMVRQIMEFRGFCLDVQRVPVRFCGLFSTASRYTR